MRDNKLKNRNKKQFSLNKDDTIKFLLLALFTFFLNLAISWNNNFSTQTIAGATLIIGLLLVILYKDFVRYNPGIDKDYKLLILTGTLLSGNLLIGRGFQGIGIGLFTTAYKALIMDLAPPEKRGEALGLGNLSFGLAIIAGPPLGEYAYHLGGYSRYSVSVHRGRSARRRICYADRDPYW